MFMTIGGWIAGALFTSASAIALATQLIGGALAFGAKLGWEYLNRQKARKYSAVQGETQFGGDVPASTLFGIGAAKGHRIFYAKWGKGNKYNAEVFVLANGWCDGLEPYVLFYSKKHTLVARPKIGNEVAHYGVQGFDNLISIRFYDGRPGQKVDQKLVNDTADLGRRWHATSVVAGQAYVVVERQFDADKFEKGKPDMSFALRGLREYDPRFDSTVAGGSGSQRLNDPSTWRHTLNPAVHRLNYQLGLRGLISGRVIIGEGKTLGQLDLGTYFASMNVADTLRNGKKLYQCSLWVNSNDDHTEILKEFDDAMAGYGLNRRGLSGVIAGTPQIPVLEITADDLSLDREHDIQPRKSGFEMFNHLSGQFTSPENQWQPDSLKPIKVNADVADDGRPRGTSNDFLQVTDPDIAQYLLTIRYRQNRLGGVATLPVSWRVGLRVQEGEWVTFDGKDWLVNNWRCDEDFRFWLELSETSADIYDDSTIEPGPIIVPPTAPVNPSLLSTVEDFSVEAGLVTSADGYDTPVLHFRWTPPDDPTITAVRFFYRIDGREQEIQDQCTTPEEGFFETDKGVQSGVDYVARATITTVPDRLKTFTPWATTAAPTGYLTVLAGVRQLKQDLRDLVKRQHQELDDTIARMEEFAANVGTATAEDIVQRTVFKQELGNVKAEISEEKALRVSSEEAFAQETLRISAALDQNTSQIAEEKTARSTADSSLAQSIQVLNGRVGTTETLIASEKQARVDGQNALAQDISLVSVKADAGSAGGMVQWKAEAGPAGYTVSYSVQGRVNANGAWIYGGMSLDVGPNGARWRFIGDQFVLADAAGNVYALFQPGTNYLNNAFIKELTTDNIKTGGIDSPALAFRAVTEFSPLTYDWTKTTQGPGTYDDGGWKTVATFVVNNPASTPIIEFLSLQATVAVPGSGSGDAYLAIRRDGVIVGECRMKSNGTKNFSLTSYIDDRKTTYTYEIMQWNTMAVTSGNTGTMTVKSRSGVLYWKR